MKHNPKKYSSAAWATIRAAALKRAGYRCEDCGRTGRLECHHIVPVSSGGTDADENLRVLCRECHFRQHRKRPFKLDIPGRVEWTNWNAELEHRDGESGQT